MNLDRVEKMSLGGMELVARHFRVAPAAWVIVCLGGAVVGEGRAADLPDTQRAYLLEAPVSKVGASADGRLVVTVGSSEARYFDAYAATTFSSTDTDNKIDVCSDPVGVFVDRSGSTYYVHIPCGTGMVYQFIVSESDDSSHPMALIASDVPASEEEVYEVAELDTITAAVLDESDGLLYLTGTEVQEVSISTTYAIYSLESTTLAGSITREIPLDNDISPEVLARIRNGFVAVESDGSVWYVSTTDGNQFATLGCGVAPRQLVPINDSLVLMLGESEQIYFVTLRTDNVPECTSADWGFSTTPASATLVTRDGDHSAISELYVRGAVDSVDGIWAFPAPSSDESLYYESFIETTEGISSDDVLLGTYLSRVYLGSSTGLSAITAGPWITATPAETEPIVVTDLEGEFSVTLRTDEAISDCFHASLDPPFESSCSGNIGLGDPPEEGGDGITITIDVNDLEFDGDYEQVFFYGTDDGGSLGWTSVWVRKIDTPSVLEGFELGFGNQSLYITLVKPDDANEIEMLIAEDPFESSSDVYSDYCEWFDCDSTFLVDDSTEVDGVTEVSEFAYPPDGAWPISLGFVDDTVSETSTDAWTEGGGNIVYQVIPLANNTEYYVAVRSLMDGVSGAWSDVLSGMPEQTCGAACIVDDAPGFCAYNQTCSQSSERPGRSSVPFALAFLAGVVVVVRREGSRCARRICPRRGRQEREPPCSS